jgi:hypothetical protein
MNTDLLNVIQPKFRNEINGYKCIKKLFLLIDKGKKVIKKSSQEGVTNHLTLIRS